MARSHGIRNDESPAGLLRSGAGMESSYQVGLMQDRLRAIALGMLIATAVVVSTIDTASAATSPPQGFGASTPGGTGQPVVRVTNLNDTGPGSFREAVSKGNRTIVFDVAGQIVLTNHLYVYGPFVTIDGFSAPGPGITLKNYGLIIRGNRGGNNIIVRGLRIRDASIDGIQIATGASNILIEHVSVQGSADGNLDITESSRDVTVAWSVFAAPIGESKNSLIKYNPSRVTLHHNVFVKGRQRNPQIRIDDAGTPASDTTADIRNNLIWDWSLYGTIIWYGPRANVVNNFYAAPSGSSTTKRNAIVVCEGDCDGGVAASRAWAHVAGNVSADDLTAHINATGNTATPFPAPHVDTEDACTAAHRALHEAGARPLDAIDQQYLGLIRLPSCGTATTPTLAASPASLAFQTQQGGPTPAPKTASVRELAGLATIWTARTTAPWLAVTPTFGATPASLAVTVDARVLPAGRHDARVVVEVAGGGSSVQLPVTLDVAEPAPVPTASTVTLTITKGADDASESRAGAVRVNELAQRVGRGYLQGWRFTGVGIPAGAVIAAAKLELYGVAHAGGDVALHYVGEAAADAAAFTATPRSLSSRARTTAVVVDTPAAWTAGAYNAAPDLAAIVQEIVDLPDWQTGRPLAIFAADDRSDAVRMVGTAERRPVGTRGARLTITYSLP